MTYKHPEQCVLKHVRTRLTVLTNSLLICLCSAGFKADKKFAMSAATSTTGAKFEMWTITGGKLHFVIKINELATVGSCQHQPCKASCVTPQYDRKVLARGSDG